MFTNKEQLCQSFWQSVKEQRFKAKKIEGGGQFAPPPLKASRVNELPVQNLGRAFALPTWRWLRPWKRQPYTKPYGRFPPPHRYYRMQTGSDLLGSPGYIIIRLCMGEYRSSCKSKKSKLSWLNWHEERSLTWLTVVAAIVYLYVAFEPAHLRENWGKSRRRTSAR